MDDQDNDKKLQHVKTTVILFRSTITIVVLIGVIQGFLILLKDSVPSELGSATGVFFVSFVFIIAVILYLNCKILLISEEQDVYIIYTWLKVIFNLSLSIFLLVILLWVAYLRGVLNSPFSAVLCTTPVSLIFIAARTKYNDSYSAADMEKSTNNVRLLKGLERISALTSIGLYIICVVLVELWIANLLDPIPVVNFAFLKQSIIQPDKLLELRSNTWYIVLSYVAFYGSVISTLATYFNAKQS